MTTKEQNNKIKIYISKLVEKATFREYLTLATSFSIVISIIYLTTYWSNFRIEIFEYIPISNLIFWAIYPFIISLVIIPIFIFLILFIEPKSIILIASIISAIFLITSVVVMKILYFYVGIIFFVAGFLIFVMGKKINELIEKNRSIKIPMIIIISILVLFTAWLLGLYKANKIKDGLNYKYIYSTQTTINSSKTLESEYRYIGNVDDNIFFWEPVEKTTIILKHNQINLLKFSYFNIEDNLIFEKEDFFKKRWEFLKTIPESFK